MCMPGSGPTLLGCSYPDLSKAVRSCSAHRVPIPPKILTCHCRYSNSRACSSRLPPAPLARTPRARQGPASSIAYSKPFRSLNACSHSGRMFRRDRCTIGTVQRAPRVVLGRRLLICFPFQRSGRHLATHWRSPRRFTLGIKPIYHLASYEVPCRFRYRIQDRRLYLGFKLQRIETLIGKICLPWCGITPARRA
jgi:hypothetical protein